MDEKKKRGWRNVENVPIFVQTSSLIPFDDFLAEVDTKNLFVALSSDGSKGADFTFRWVCMSVDWGQALERSLTLKHLLYLYYHHIFGIRTYVISKNFWTEKERWTIIDERTRIFRGIQEDNILRPSSKRIMWDEKIFPIRIWQENEDFFDEIKSILGKFSPNKEYDKKELEETKEKLSLQRGEIFEYFTTASKSAYQLSTSDVRKRLADEWLDDGVSDEILEKRVALVDKFLLNILQ